MKTKQTKIVEKVLDTVLLEFYGRVPAGLSIKDATITRSVAYKAMQSYSERHLKALRNLMAALEGTFGSDALSEMPEFEEAYALINETAYDDPTI